MQKQETLSQNSLPSCLSKYDRRNMKSQVEISGRILRGEIMKIVVIGGTGLIGSKVIPNLREHGHEAVSASPNSGVNTITGQGLAEVLKDASVIVDVSNSPSWDDAAVMNFFKTSTRNILEYGAAGGVKHLVVLSVVGT